MALVKKKEKTYEPIEPLIGVGDDYHIYHMSIRIGLLQVWRGWGSERWYFICFLETVS